MVDVELVYNEEQDYYDIALDENGDFKMINSFDTAILVSLFTDDRAASTEVALPQYRRGWWGNVLTLPNFSLGSKLWLLDQARLIQNTVNRASNYGQLALTWFVTDGYSLKIDTNAFFKDNGVYLNIDIFNQDGKTESRAYLLWQNSGNLNNGN